MDNEIWQKIDAIYNQALDLPIGQRDAYLSNACEGDESLRSEIAALIAAYENSPEFLETSVFDMGLSALVLDQQAKLCNTTLGKYQIFECIGSGGMGTVYRAIDHLGREVALKFLKPDLLDDAWARQQLEIEATFVANLNHKNICTVHDYQEIEGRGFISMEYVRGVPLCDLIEKRAASPDEIASIIKQIVGAIFFAHSHSIIHRDIKPGNVIVQDDGTIKVLDFGLAKVIHDGGDKPLGLEAQLTHASRKGLILGTVAYMSPEQLRCETLDRRTDVFSLGTLMYELIAGVHPFDKKSEAETISAVLSGKVSFDKTPASGFRLGHRRIIEKCLQPNVEDRYDDAGELLRDLTNLKESRIYELMRHGWKVAAAFVILISMLAGLYIFARETKTYNVAFLPFSNETREAGYDFLSEGLAESLSNKLATTSGFKPVPYSKVSGVRSIDSNTSLPPEFQADFVLAGRVYLVDRKLTVETKLIDAVDGRVHRWSTYDLNPDEIPAAEEQMLKRMFESRELLRPFAAIGINNPTLSDTSNTRAFKEYLNGRYFWRLRDPENVAKAIGAFQKAIDLDPGYASAHAGLSQCYVLLSSTEYGGIPTNESYSRARAAARQAVQIDPNNAEAHTSLGVVLTKHDWNWAEAEREYRLAIQIDPDYGAAYYWLSGLLSISGRIDESVAAAEKAKELDPFSPLVEYNLSRTYYFARQYERSLEILQRQTITENNDTKIRYQYGLIYLQMGRYDEALAAFGAVAEKNTLLATPVLGYTYARMGRQGEARKMITELNRLAKEKYVPPQEYAIIYIGLEDKGKAFENLNKAFAERYGSLSAIKVEPIFDPIRNDERFAALLTKMNLN